MRTGIGERLAAKIVIDPATGCHNWTGATNGRGYGRIGADGPRRLLSTHRVAYELAKGPIPDGLVIDHLCRNPACCNPEHLEAVTQRENTQRGNSGLKNSSKTHCPHGHAYTAENTYTAPGSVTRYCRICIKARTRSDASREKTNARRREKNAQAVLDRGGTPRKKRWNADSGGSPASRAKSDNHSHSGKAGL